MLEYSEAAQKELGETRELISLLSEGLEKEWKSELSQPENEFSLVDAAGEENVVAVNFAQASSGSVRSAKNHGPVLISLAAVLAGLLVVGGMLSRPEAGQNSVATAAIVGFSSDDHVWVAEGDQSAEVVEEPLNLVLLDELNLPFENLELVDFEITAVDPVVDDPFAIDGGGAIMNVSMQAGLDDEIPVHAAPIRLDSYLPAAEGHVTYAVHFENGFDSLIPQGFSFHVDGQTLSADEVSTEYLRVQAQLKDIVSDLDDPNLDLKLLQGRLIELLENHRELGSQIGAE
jgi:hypothetical protein